MMRMVTKDPISLYSPISRRSEPVRRNNPLGLDIQGSSQWKNTSPPDLIVLRLGKVCHRKGTRAPKQVQRRLPDLSCLREPNRGNVESGGPEPKDAQASARVCYETPIREASGAHTTGRDLASQAVQKVACARIFSSIQC